MLKDFLAQCKEVGVEVRPEGGGLSADAMLTVILLPCVLSGLDAVLARLDDNAASFAKACLIRRFGGWC